MPSGNAEIYAAFNDERAATRRDEEAAAAARREQAVARSARLAEMSSAEEEEAVNWTDKYAELVEQRLPLLEEGRSCLAMLAADHFLLEDYDKMHGVAADVPTLDALLDAGKAVTEEVVRALEGRLRSLEATLERLRTRCDSDGLFVALRATMEGQSLSPRLLCKAVAEMPAKKGSQLQTGGKAILPQQLKGWLNKEGIQYTERGMAFFAQTCGAKMPAFAKGEPVKTDLIIYAFDKVKAKPVTL